jgi:hypothetical protein
MTGFFTRPQRGCLQITPRGCAAPRHAKPRRSGSPARTHGYAPASLEHLPGHEGGRDRATDDHQRSNHGHLLVDRHRRPGRPGGALCRQAPCGPHPHCHRRHRRRSARRLGDDGRQPRPRPHGVLNQELPDRLRRSSCAALRLRSHRRPGQAPKLAVKTRRGEVKLIRGKRSLGGSSREPSTSLSRFLLRLLLPPRHRTPLHRGRVRGAISETPQRVRAPRPLCP